MPATRDEILEAALQLPESDRIVIADRLLQTLPEELPLISLDDPDFLDELESRSNDGTAGIPWWEIQAELKKKCGG